MINLQFLRFRLNKKAIAIFYTLIVTFVVCNLHAQNKESLLADFELAKANKYNKPDTAIYLFKKCSDGFMLLGDTTKVIRCNIEASTLHATKGNYSESYDGYWEALSLSQDMKDSMYTGSAYDGLGVLYGLYYRHQEALANFQKSLNIKKSLIASKQLATTNVVNTYYLMAINYRDQGNYSKAQTYLDSCYITRKEAGNVGSTSYIDAEQGYLLYHNNKLQEAEDLLLDVEQSFLSSNESYLVILYSFMGDIYAKMNKVDKSSEYYLKSLAIAEEFKSHQNFVPDVYKKLGDLYLSINQPKRAYQYLEKSFNTTDSLFGVRNANNRKVLEVKDDFRQKQEMQKEILEQANVTELKQEKRILFLRNTVLTIILISSILISVVTFFYLRHRHRVSEKILKNKQKIKEEKNHEILELKNKELTSSALQLIEKDQLLIEIKNKLSSVKNKDLKELIAKINANSKHDWKEFDTRFTSVNQGFYKSLSEKFPELTQRDHKLCALIKLNFSSKEMSLLLGISIESVHTSRYRLRQKLSLDKGENLTEFIAKI
ncbi:hypothetical protein [Labilibacter marinus]|uniref:hypothetical protein n=1 Tax=Labilibacter marinus TaxID=1477105 RepID=UPI00117A295C|nr:hypothetical protein [Labilibacter marinus]